ncbi:MAG: nucleotidyltransferase substrate binding protein [Bacteroidetes bacterium]|nr:nucleotidyltransferase substrate binding protein [Bacteroidota bacterium]
MNDLLNVLKEELQILNEAARVLNYSYQKCSKINTQIKLTDEDLESFDSLTARFARLSDIIMQKIFRMIEKADLEIQGSVRDSIYNAEKKGLISDADTFIDIRELRNLIAHEYIPEAFKEIFIKVLEYTPDLLLCLDNIKKYCNTKYGILY